MSFALRYRPPTGPVDTAAGSGEDALYELADAGAFAVLSVEEYTLELHGTCLVELVHACRGLLEALSTGATAAGDDAVERELPALPPGAHVHSWLFACFLTRLPVLVFASAGGTTWVFTRTLEESEAMPLVVLPGRDRESPASLPTKHLVAEVEAFLAAVLASCPALGG